MFASPNITKGREESKTQVQSSHMTYEEMAAARDGKSPFLFFLKLLS